MCSYTRMVGSHLDPHSEATEMLTHLSQVAEETSSVAWQTVSWAGHTHAQTIWSILTNCCQLDFFTSIANTSFRIICI